MTNSRRIGAHLSTSGGIDLAIQQAQRIGANCLQVFSGSPRMWRRTPLDKINQAKIFSAQAACGVTPLVTHALYLVNLASDKPELLQASIDSLIHDLKFDAHIKGSGVVVHLGSHQGRGFDAVKAQMVAAIKQILESTPEESHFLMENSAGQNGKIASDLHEIRWLLDQINSPRLGWCLDTCHAFAAGYELKKLSTTVKELNLWATLKVIHVNDSRDPFDSGRDRHANMGTGLIPAEDFKLFLNAPETLEIPLITEAPGFDDLGPDAENIARIKAICT